MTSGVVMAYGGKSVDFNAAGVCDGVMITDRFNNPIFALPTPVADGGVVLGDNIIGINIGFVNNSFDFTFQLHEGPGSFDFVSGTTAYEKLKSMALTKNPKTLTLNGHVFYGHIENLNVPWKSGFKNLSANCTLSFRLTKNLIME